MNGQLTIKCKQWDENEREAKDRELCEVVGLLQDRATERFGDPNVRRLRNDFRNGRITFPQDRAGRLAMESLLRFEDEYLSAYINAVCKIAHSFHQKNKGYVKIDVDDYIQEGCMALTNAVCHYDGATKFITYLYNAVKRNLFAFLREQEELAGVARSTKKLKKLVVRTMNQFDYSAQEAIDYLRSKGAEISQADEEKVFDALYSIIALSPQYDVPQDEKEVDLDQEAVRLCIDQSGLTDLERELIEAFMQGDDKCRSSIVNSGRINPTTGRPYTKQALSLAFKRGCDKIKNSLKARKVAA